MKQNPSGREPGFEADPTEPVLQGAPDWVWPLLLAVAALIRLWLVGSEDSYLHPDAEFQGLEPAYDLVWGGGDLPWEFDEGIRSWVWPGLLAGPMALVGALDLGGPGVSMVGPIVAAKLVCVAIDLAGMVAMVAMLRRHTRASVALLFGGLYAMHPAFALPGIQPLIDLPAGVALLWVLERGRVLGSAGLGATGAGSAPWERRHAIGFGFAFGCALMLRVQLWTALFVIAVIVALRLRSTPREQRQLGGLLAALAFTMLAFGAVDWLTWGRPFSSTLDYLRFNFGEGGRSFGAMPADRYWVHAALAMPGLRIPLAFLAAWGCRRTPGLALVALAFFVPHQLLSYRVWRFVQPGLPLLLLLAACGLHDLLERARPQFARGLVALWLAAEVGSAGVAWHSESLWETTWLHNQGGTAAIAKSRALHRAYRFLSGHDEARNFVNQVLPKGGAPGRASLGQRVQIAHPVGMGPPPPMSRHIIDAAQTQAARRAGFVELWRDPQGLVTIVQRPRVTPADPSTQGR